jgi:hypothetical protein
MDHTGGSSTWCFDCKINVRVKSANPYVKGGALWRPPHAGSTAGLLDAKLLRLPTTLHCPLGRVATPGCQIGYT